MCNSIQVAEALPAEDNSMDAVIGTLVLCSVNNIDMALRGNNYTSLARTMMAISFFVTLYSNHNMQRSHFGFGNMEIQIKCNTLSLVVAIFYKLNIHLIHDSLYSSINFSQFFHFYLHASVSLHHLFATECQHAYYFVPLTTKSHDSGQK